MTHVQEGQGMVNNALEEHIRLHVRQIWKMFGRRFRLGWQDSWSRKVGSMQNLLIGTKFKI